ncbi:MAG: glycosyltransferase family 4 protein [Flavobacteriales bacterium]
MHWVGDIPERIAAGDDRVKLHGPVHDPERMKHFYDSCDVLMLPSHSEGMPNVLLEAMGRGMTAVATDVGSVNELLSNERGRLIRRPSRDLIVRAMEELIDLSEEDLARLKQNAYDHIKENFLWERIVHGLTQELYGLLNKEGGKDPNK